jgi:secreted PhoX family phosphatase
MIDDSENFTSNPRIAFGAVTMNNIIDERLSRRALLGGLAATALAGCAASETGPVTAAKDSAKPVRGFDFPEIARAMDENHHVAAGYRADILIRWGDPMFADSPAFDPTKQSAERNAASSAITTTSWALCRCRRVKRKSAACCASTMNTHRRP